MRAEYDFSHGVVGKYAARYAKGTSVAILHSKPTTRRSSRPKPSPLRTGSKRLSGKADNDIRSAIRSGPDAAPEADAAWLRNAKIEIPEPKKAVSIRLDRDITEWFQRQGRGYQTRINAVLRAYVDAHR
jgi:uncharacterized protein (DUF4415 family)